MRSTDARIDRLTLGLAVAGDDQPARHVPITFEGYTASRYAPVPHGTECTGCMAGPAIGCDHGNAYCAECLRHSHGFEAAEELYVRTVIGAAVDAALALGADSGLVAQAVRDALAGRVNVTAPLIL